MMCLWVEPYLPGPCCLLIDEKRNFAVMKKMLAAVFMIYAVSDIPASAAAKLEPIAPVMTCEGLRHAGVGSPEAPTSITDASEQSINGHDMCVVKGFVSPRIGFEVHLPMSGWTQRYLQTGCGGLCGRVGIESPQRDCTPETNGEFVMASTDMGHDTNGGTWGASDMQLRVDFAYRGVHVTSVVAKQLITAFYGQAPKYSYFSGCSDGGREALMEAQRFPDDFDGIAAGAPALNFLVQNSFYHGWNAAIVDPMSSHPALTAKDLPVLHAAAIKACDGADGTADGIVSDPSACKVDTTALICSGGQTDGCLSETAAKAATELYRGAHDGDTKLVIGSLMPGSELAWEGVLVPGDAGKTPPAGAPGNAPPPLPKPIAGAAAPSAAPKGMDQPHGMPPGMVMSPMIASEMIPNLAYAKPFDPDWQLKDFKFTTASLEEMRPMHALFDATNPDLAPFHAAGGKILMWHGLADPHISPANSVAYYQAIEDTIGAEAVQDMMRLYLIPGLYHCGGGYGMTSVDVMTPLMNWVEKGEAPDTLVASASDADAAVGKGRTLLAYPNVSVLRNGGSADNPSDWTGSQPSKSEKQLYKRWAGADFFTPVSRNSVALKA